MKEQQIQAKITKKLEADGYFVVKLMRTSKNGIPDLLCHREGQTMYIEVKQPSGKLSMIQEIRINELRAKGITVKIWTDYDTNFESKKLGTEIDF